MTNTPETNEVNNEVKSDIASTVQPRKKGGSIAGIFILVAGTAIVSTAVYIFSMVGSTLMQAKKEMNMSSETVSQLADKIVDPTVSPQKLETLGYYSMNLGGVFVDGCRKEVLEDAFNQGANTQVKAEKITTCVKRELLELSASSRRR